LTPRGTSEATSARYDLAREKARALLTLRGYRFPVDVRAIAQALEIPITERLLAENTRGTIGDIGGRRAIILNRDWKFSSEAERRWVLAEELGHVLLEHRLTESTAPGTQRIGLLEWQRGTYEREAKAFAAELLMPLARLREWWLAETSLPAYSRDSGERNDLRIQKLAREFGVTKSAMRVRLEQLRLIRSTRGEL
jgi:Zn-dependent peptidase ImmA (M78 family)